MHRVILFFLLTLVSCNSGSPESMKSMGNYLHDEHEIILSEEIEQEPPRTSKPTSAPQNSLEKGSKIIKRGSMKFEVSKLNKSKNRVDTLVKDVGGYYENESYHTYGNRINYSLTIRVPNIKFDSLVKVLESGVGELKEKNINAKDVTEEYVDLNIRLENNLSYLKQYKNILTKAKSVKEILEVQEKIRRIEAEIESKKGRLKYLDDRITYSTLNLELSETRAQEISNKPSFALRISNAFKNGIQGFLNFVILAVNMWPFLLIILILILLRKRIWRKLRRN